MRDLSTRTNKGSFVPALTEVARSVLTSVDLFDYVFVRDISVWVGCISGHKNRGRPYCLTNVDCLRVWLQHWLLLTRFDWIFLNCVWADLIYCWRSSWPSLTKLSWRSNFAPLTSVDFLVRAFYRCCLLRQISLWLGKWILHIVLSLSLSLLNFWRIIRRIDQRVSPHWGLSLIDAKSCVLLSWLVFYCYCLCSICILLSCWCDC